MSWHVHTRRLASRQGGGDQPKIETRCWTQWNVLYSHFLCSITVSNCNSHQFLEKKDSQSLVSQVLRYPNFPKDIDYLLVGVALSFLGLTRSIASDQPTSRSAPPSLVHLLSPQSESGASCQPPGPISDEQILSRKLGREPEAFSEPLSVHGCSSYRKRSPRGMCMFPHGKQPWPARFLRIGLGEREKHTRLCH